MIGIVDYGLGNLASIRNMLSRMEIESVIASDAEVLHKCQRLILPGVGAFDQGIQNLHDFRLWDVLHELVLGTQMPILGICLGAQLLTQSSEEGKLPGLGWIQGRTIEFDKTKMSKDHRIPNMGWRYVDCEKDHTLVRDLPANARFYFVHSFHFICDDPSDVTLKANHGFDFVCGYAHSNILGVQFHPEKSHRFGMALLKNFASFEVA